MQMFHMECEGMAYPAEKDAFICQQSQRVAWIPQEIGAHVPRQGIVIAPTTMA